MNINKVEVKQEQVDSLEENQQIRRELVFVVSETIVKIEKHDWDSENPQISPTNLAKVKEEPRDDLFPTAMDDIREVKASDYFVNTSDLVNIKQEVTDLEVPSSELISTPCDLPSINSNLDFFDQPCSSKQAQELFKEAKIKKSAGKEAAKKKKYTCPVCRKNFLSSKLRLKHFGGHFGKILNMCDLCGQFFTNKSYFLNHYGIHFVKNLNKNLLKVNLKINTDLDRKNSSKLADLKKTLFNCTICFKQFNYRCRLNKHLKTHSGERPFKCGTCLKRFTVKSSLDRHMIVHSESDEKPFTCEICSKSFKRNYYLKIHLKIHADERPYQCQKCFRRFIHKQSLKKHTKTHIGKNEFYCEICLIDYGQKVYSCTHFIEKLFGCEICFKKFTRKSSLDSHLNTHTGVKLFKCKICFKEYTFKSSLFKHSKTHAQDSQESLQCTSINPVKNNSFLNVYECNICSKKFIFENSLLVHLKSHGADKPHYKCDVCFKQFIHKHKLLNHLKTHSKSF